MILGLDVHLSHLLIPLYANIRGVLRTNLEMKGAVSEGASIVFQCFSLMFDKKLRVINTTH
jgi:hypothetical protein